MYLIRSMAVVPLLRLFASLAAIYGALLGSDFTFACGVSAAAEVDVPNERRARMREGLVGFVAADLDVEFGDSAKEEDVDSTTDLRAWFRELFADVRIENPAFRLELKDRLPESPLGPERLRVFVNAQSLGEVDGEEIVVLTTTVVVQRDVLIEAPTGDLAVYLADVYSTPLCGAVRRDRLLREAHSAIAQQVRWLADDWVRANAAANPAAEIATGDSAQELATKVDASGRITLATAHSSGEVDEATAQLNIEQTARGEAARRSSYGGAPGGTVALRPEMLRGMLALSEDYEFLVTEIAGGAHNANSRHYVGTAFDVARLGGSPVSAANPQVAAFMQRARALGATEVLGPGAPGHSTHIHVAWPRP